ncbi:MAG: sialidase family protein [Planctomycetota bacterium]
MTSRRIQILTFGLLLLGSADVLGMQEPQTTDFAIPVIDLSEDRSRQVIVDREDGQYLGHPTTLLLEDGRTILCVYPKGHGRGAIVYKRSSDGGKTWSERLDTPASWATSLETPTLHRVVDAEGKKRIILFSGLYPIRMSVSEDDGLTWSELEPIGDFGGIVTMSSVIELKTGAGHYLALFHDDGRFIRKGSKRETPPVMTLFQSRSTDGGLTWSQPETIFASSDIHLCEPGALRSPDGQEIALLLRENARRKNSHVVFSTDEGHTWSEPLELPAELTGDRHVARYAADGRLVLSFRDNTPKSWNSPSEGDWVAWVGTYEDIVQGKPGQYRLRLMDNTKAHDCAYPGLECLPDGTFVATTYGHWTEGEEPYIVSVRFRLDEIDALAEKR